MKKVYLVCERSVWSKGDSCGVAYYSSLQKAKKDFYDRAKSYGIDDSQITTEGKNLVTFIGKNDRMIIRLDAHEVN